MLHYAYIKYIFYENKIFRSLPVSQNDWALCWKLHYNYWLQSIDHNYCWPHFLNLRFLWIFTNFHIFYLNNLLNKRNKTVNIWKCAFFSKMNFLLYRSTAFKIQHYFQVKKYQKTHHFKLLWIFSNIFSINFKKKSGSGKKW